MEKYLCKKTVRMEPSNLIGFTEGKIYQRTNPEVWPPDRSIKHCLIDNMGSEHFFDRQLFNEHFERVGVVENFAHPFSKEALTEALNKLDFVKWYSGMDAEKILKAYERWKKESGNSA